MSMARGLHGEIARLALNVPKRVGLRNKLDRCKTPLAQSGRSSKRSHLAIFVLHDHAEEMLSRSPTAGTYQRSERQITKLIWQSPVRSRWWIGNL